MKLNYTVVICWLILIALIIGATAFPTDWQRAGAAICTALMGIGLGAVIEANDGRE